MDDFRIEFDNQQAVYFPGQAVTGKIYIQSRESIKARFLKICIHGGAHTKWSEHEHKHRTDARGRSESFTEHVDYSSTVNYLTGESMAWSSTDGSNKIPAGRNIFPFAFSTPVNCPPSFEGIHGSIRYSVHVELDRPWKFNKKSRKCFSVIPAYDLNITPTAINPMVNSTSKNTGLIFKKGVVSMTVSLPKRGYVPGELLPITVNIENGSKKPVSVVRAKMMQLSVFNASRGRSTCHDPMATGYAHPHQHHKNDEKIVAEGRRNVDVPACSKGQVILSLKIPAIVPSFQCPIITVDYCISVKVDTGATFGNTLKCEFPLIIGTIPIRQMAMPAGFPTAPPATMPTVNPSAPPYPTVGDQGASAPPVYPSGAPSAPPASPTAPGTFGLPPSYEESVYGASAPKGDTDSEPFAPRYPVYNNLEQSAPALPQKTGF
ncbi:unnamed protein product [Caenorhabditis sp. 36 PRJEB53466]|nr:unnamed protein product [Caenorhabditis sp. 36 PRJEB53466]